VTLISHYQGCLLGTALGDSVLLPGEGLTRHRIKVRFPGALRHRLLGQRGMISDDTEHTFLLGQALLEAGEDPDRFARALARRLRWWLLSLPAGCGMATARGLLRSWLGFSPARSGVWSAGNGPAMRSALLGVRWSHDDLRRRAFVRASTLITHRDPQAEIAAQAVADAAAWIIRGDPPEHLWAAWRSPPADNAWIRIIAILEDHHCRGASLDEVAGALGCAKFVSGYAYHSVPIVLYAWLRHRHDPHGCLSAILACGGDTDTIGAMAGALLGIDDGPQGLPQDLIEQIIEWPLTTDRLRDMGSRLASDDHRPVSWQWMFQPLRNVLFLFVVLEHGFRRLFF
jgi:ADP-ribosyl-[dinitrogen reductase] hydrolase